MRLAYRALELHLRHTFHIAHGASATRRNVVLQLGDGVGEAAPVAYHGESAPKVIAALERWRTTLEALDDPAAIVWVLQRIEGSQAAKAAVDLALHDALGKQLSRPVRDMLGLRDLPLPPTSFTIAISEPEHLAQRVQEAAHYPILKIKLGTERDEEIVRTVREHAPHAVIRVDANAAWMVDQAREIIPRLAEFDLELIEQPLHVDDLDGLRQLRSAHLPVPIVADEPVKTAADVARLAPLVDGVNVKLMKSGGIAGALAAIHTARAHGLRVMLGGMIETSLGATAAAQLAGLVDWVDLDGPLLITNDLYQGVRYEGAQLHLPDGAGLGVTER